MALKPLPLLSERNNTALVVAVISVTVNDSITIFLNHNTIALVSNCLIANEQFSPLPIPYFKMLFERFLNNPSPHFNYLSLSSFTLSFMSINNLKLVFEYQGKLLFMFCKFCARAIRETEISFLS